MLPTWPPDEQIISADNSQKKAANTFRQYGRLAVEAAPGTGKTFLGIYLALCANRLGWTSATCPTLFLTFSRNARVQIEQALQAYRKNGWMNAAEEDAIRIFNYHAFFFDLIQQKAGMWGCKEKLRPASNEEHKTQLTLVLPNTLNNREILNQAGSVYSLLRFSVRELLKQDSQLLLDNGTIANINTAATIALRNGRPHYNDFAPLFLNLLELDPQLTEWLRLKYPVIVMDEFQDTDIVQWTILEKIKPLHPILLYDRFQMIYEWRGARLDRLDQAKQHLGIQSGQEEQLINNHRCEGQDSLIQFIQELRADDLLGNTVNGVRERPWLSLQAIQPLGGRFPIPEENRCLSWLRFNSSIINFHETTAILTRNNFLADHLYRNMRVRPERGSHFACRWIGGEDNPDEKVRDWLWHLRSVKTDNELRSWLGSILDILLPPSISRDLGISFSEEFSKEKDQLFARKKKEIFQAIKTEWIPIWESISIKDCCSLTVGVGQVLRTAINIISTNGYLDPDLVYYIKQLGRSSENYRPNNSEQFWQDFCDYLENSHLKALFTKLRNPSSGVYILTIHQSKGREFDHVIIPWLSGAGEPFKTTNGRRFNSILDYLKLEDRKLLYVAITRARRKVTIIYPQNDPSPFIRSWKLIT
jgi:hypothetical protein